MSSSSQDAQARKQLDEKKLAAVGINDHFPPVAAVCIHLDSDHHGRPHLYGLATKPRIHRRGNHWD